MTQLILLRHGQSQWNLENRFTGWVDVPLSEKGKKEASDAGLKLKDFRIDKVYTTPLQRANMTFRLAWEAIGDSRYPLFKYLDGGMKDWAHFEGGGDFIDVMITPAFNERFYGDLQGLNKEESKAKFGEEQVRIWRRSFDVPPPNGESLKDTLSRVLPVYNATVAVDLKAGKNVLISAHGNSLRAIAKQVEGLSDEAVASLEIPTGVPIVYELDADLKVVSKRVYKDCKVC